MTPLRSSGTSLHLATESWRAGMQRTLMTTSSIRCEQQSRPTRISFANRMTEIYNPIGAIEIFAGVLAGLSGLQAAYECGWRTLVVDVEPKIAELGIGDAVEFLTDLKSWRELHSVYARADIFLLPAYFSNGNFTILEAMASGMGVVVSDRILGIGKMIQEGSNGFNCEPTVEAFMNRAELYIRKARAFCSTRRDQPEAGGAVSRPEQQRSSSPTC